MPRTTFYLPKLFLGYFIKKLAQKFRQDVNAKFCFSHIHDVYTWRNACMKNMQDMKNTIMPTNHVQDFADGQHFSLL